MFCRRFMGITYLTSILPVAWMPLLSFLQSQVMWRRTSPSAGKVAVKAGKLTPQFDMLRCAVAFRVRQDSGECVCEAQMFCGVSHWVAAVGVQRAEGVSSGPAPAPVPSAGTAGGIYQDFIYGVIKAMNKDELVLTKTNAGVDQTFKLNKKTKYIHDGKNSSVESLKLGEQVWVDVKKDKKTGDFNARKVVTGAFIMPST